MLSASLKRHLADLTNHELALQKAGPADFSLENFRHLLTALGNPQEKFKSLQIAGTNGKGSTAVYLSEILKSAGYRVGLYTSPHLFDLNERIRILAPGRKETKKIFSGCISDHELNQAFILYKKALAKLPLAISGGITYFEALTALAFLHFSRRKVDFAVLETGLGGRFDATNVVNSLVCGLTPISLEHTKILGNTLGKIAAEKAAIIKQDRQPVIVAPQSVAALKVIQAHCASLNTRPCLVGRDILISRAKRNGRGQSFHLKSSHFDLKLETRLLGDWQLKNAAVAAGMAEKLAGQGYAISPSEITEGIRAAAWPGRFQVCGNDPPVILDCGHNPAAAKNLSANIKNIFGGGKVILIFGVSKDKDWRKIIAALKPLSRSIILTRARHPRALKISLREAEDLAPGVKFFETGNIQQAFRKASAVAQKGDIILITGSIFLVADALKILRESNKRK